jgi:hypothetical protein
MITKRMKRKLHEILICVDSLWSSTVPQNPLAGNMKTQSMPWPESDIATNFEMNTRVHKLINLLSSNNHECKIERKGSINDGGYFVFINPLPYDGIISFGVGSDISFEMALRNPKTVIHFYDNSVEQIPLDIANSVFFKETVGENGVKLDGAISRLRGSSLLLKCDIEGAEWKLFEEAESKVIQKFEQIVVEFHGLQYLYIDAVHAQRLCVLEKIFRTHIPIFTNSNNFGKVFLIGGLLVPEVLEVTYLRRDLHTCSNQGLKRRLPSIQNDSKAISWTTSFELPR